MKTNLPLNRMVEFKGKFWSVSEIAITMGFEAMRLAITGKTKTFTPTQVIAWLQDISEPQKPKRKAHHA